MAYSKTQLKENYDKGSFLERSEWETYGTNIYLYEFLVQSSTL